MCVHSYTPPEVCTLIKPNIYGAHLEIALIGMGALHVVPLAQFLHEMLGPLCAPFFKALPLPSDEKGGAQSQTLSTVPYDVPENRAPYAASRAAAASTAVSSDDLWPPLRVNCSSLEALEWFGRCGIRIIP